MKHAKHRMTVLVTKGYDCTNNGITTKVESDIMVYAVWVDDAMGHRLPYYTEVKELLEKCDFIEDDALILAVPRSGRMGLDNPPAAKWVGAIRKGHWVMAGGNYVSTSNGITHDQFRYSAPISVHDRVE